MRAPRPTSFATFWASTTWNFRPFSMTCRCVSTGSFSHTSPGPYGLFSRNVAPGSATPSTSIRSRKWNWWQATKLARFTRYVERMGRGPNRRCDTVIDPAFFESYTK